MTTSYRDIHKQLRTITPFLLIVYIFLSSILTMVFMIAKEYHIPLAYLTRDPTAILHGYPFAGVISNIGIIFWSITVGICFFTSYILKEKNISISIFLFFSGLLTSILLLDDLFMFHEDIFPKYLNISQHSVYFGYFSLIVFYLINFRNIILKNEYIIFAFALLFFGSSIVCDLVLPLTNIEYLIEDGFKLFGIITWLIFFTRTSYIHLKKLQINGN